MTHKIFPFTVDYMLTHKQQSIKLTIDTHPNHQKEDFDIELLLAIGHPDVHKI